MTQISKKDTLDIADSIAQSIYVSQVVNDTDKRLSIITIRDIIEEGLNGWISECEIEQAEQNQQRYDR